MSLAVRAANVVLLSLVGSKAHRLVGTGLLGITYDGARSRTRHRLVVQCADLTSARNGRPGWVAYPAHADRKNWWRNFVTAHHADVRVAGRSVRCVGRVVDVGDPVHASAITAYRMRWPRTVVPDDAPLVVFVPTTLLIPPAVDSVNA